MRSTARRPLALSEAMCWAGLSTSTSAVTCRSPAVASPGPRLSRRMVTGSSLCTRNRRSFRLRMRSVTSSFTPGRVVNSWRASSKRTWVIDGPGDRRQQGAAQRVAQRVAEAGVERSDGEPLAVVLFFTDGFDGGSLDDEHADRGSSAVWCAVVVVGLVRSAGGASVVRTAGRRCYLE